MYTDGGIHTTVSYVAIEGHDPFTWPEVCEGVYRNVTYHCVLNSLEQFPDHMLL